MSSGAKKKLLLVEDEALIALSERRQLEKYGYAVAAAASGERAIEELERDPEIDLVLMDINLGAGIDGTEAAALILKDRDIPIVFLSSHTEPEIVEKTEKITSYGYVVKNSSITVLDASIKMAFKLFEAKKKELEKERALAVSERKYRLISDNTSDGIVHFSPDGKIDFASPSYLKQLGYAEGEALGKSAAEIGPEVHPADREELFAKIYDAIARRERELIYSYRVRHRLGHYVWREDHASLVYDEAGGYAGAYVSCRDVSDRKRIELELEESKESAERLLNIAAAIIISTDFEGRILLLNDSGHRILGYESPELIGKDYFELCLPPEIRDEVRAHLDSLKGGPREALDQRENEVVTKTGERRRILWRNSLLKDREGKPVGIFSSGEDITERKRVEDELKKAKERAEASERKLRGAHEIAKIGHWELDIRRGVFTFNDGFYALFHTSAEEVGGYEMGVEEYARRFVHPDDAYKVGEETKKAVETDDRNYSNSIEHRVVYADGGEGYISVRYFIVKDEAGATIKTFGVNQDITERKTLERELVSQRQLYEQILEQSLAGYWDWDIASGYEYLSPTFKRMFGYEDGEIENRAESWQRLIFPEDLPGVLRVFDRHVKTRGAEPFYNEVRYRHKDGSTVWVICTGKVIEWSEAGDPIRMVGCHIDISERKRIEEALREREEKYKFALEGSGLGEWDWDYTTGKVIRNERWAQMLGYTTDEIEETLQQGIELRHPDDLATIERAVDDHLAGLSDHYSIEYRMRTKAGGYKWIHDCGKIMVRDASGAPLRLCGTHADIDEAKRARDTIEGLLAEKELLLQEVHHRIKNSINTVSSLLSLQEQSMPDESAKAALRDAGNRIRSVSLLYDKLYRTDDYRALSLKTYLSALSDEIVGNFPNSGGVTLDKELDDFSLDARKLQSIGIIINELLTDIMKYAFKGRSKGRIEISSKIGESSATVVVEDDGVGMPPSVDFERSTGFGLQLVQALTRQLGGAIRIERDKGTRFVLEFPV